jgi:uncharacterized protein (UPF0332 family)
VTASRLDAAFDRIDDFVAVQGRRFVVGGTFDAQLSAAAQRAQPRREASDYAAATFELDEACELVATADRFVDAVGRMIS